MSGLPFLMTRIVNVPLLATEHTVAVALAWLGDRMDVGTVMLGTDPVELASIRMGSEGRYRPPHDYRVEGGIATIPVIGSLVSRSTSLQPPSGLTGYSAIGRALDAALGDDAVAGLMLEIDSGGGEAAGALDLARRVRQAAEVKPVWAVIDEAAGSSAYAIASGASHILLPRTATAGSVGAVAVNIGRSGELARRGQRATIIRSVSRKARPSSVEALSDDDMAEIEARIADLHGEFAQLVAEHRGLSLQAVNDLQGAMLLAPDAVARGLADEVLPAHEALPAFREHLQLGRAEPSLPQESRTTSMTTSLTRPAVPRAGGVDVEAIRREMQARFSGIMGLEEAQGPMASLASHLACETSLTVEEAAGVLAIAKSVKPATGGHTDFKQAMDRLKNPMVGPDGGGEEDGTLDALLARARLREGRT